MTSEPLCRVVSTVAVAPALPIPVVADAVALLIRLRAEQVAPEAAWDEVLLLRERHPGRFINLVWEQETYVDRVHYDLLVEVAAGTLSISYCADEAVPWPARGLQRVNESLVLRVNDDPVQIGQVVTSLDYAWHQLHVGRHLINMSLIDQEIRGRRILVTDDQLEAALTEFRVRRRLFTAVAVEQWMAEHGASQVQLEHHLRQAVARDELRRQVIGGPGAIAEYFVAHRSDFDRVQVAKLFVAERADADALVHELRDAPERLLAVAQQRFLQGAPPAELFATLWRDELEPDHAAQLFDVAPGQLAPIVASGSGFDLVTVLRKLPAALDDATRSRIGDRLFDRWLDEQRACARVEWFWGAAEAADVPAISL